MTSRSGHVVVVGTSTTVLRLTEELRRLRRDVVVVAREGRGWVVDELERREVPLVRTGWVDAQALQAAQIGQARSVVVLGVDDVEAMRLALVIEEVAPDVPMVLEMSNPSFGGALARLIGHCTILSSITLAAPSFVDAALDRRQVQTFRFAGRDLVAGHRSRVGGHLLAVLGDAGDATVLGSSGDVVLGTALVPATRQHASRRGWLGAIASVFDRRLRWVVGFLVLLMVVSTVYFRVVAHLSWLLSVYAALTVSTLTGIGDIGELSLTARFGAVVIQLLGLVLSSGVTAVIVDALISSRLRAAAGGVRGKPRHHVIVCGLGRVGTEVARLLRERDVVVVGIEAESRRANLAAARRDKVPVVPGDATDPAILRLAGVERCDAVVAATDTDAANLEIGLLARQANPDVRVVTRLFDQDLATRVEQRLELGTSRSVSMLAAPVFAAAALGRRLEQVVSVGRRVVILTELVVESATRLEGIAVDSLELPGEVQVLATRDGREALWQWPPAERVGTGQWVAVAASRRGLSKLVTTIKPRA